MPTGLPSNITIDDTEWVLHFCNFFEAWALTPAAFGGGKVKGEGLIVVHPDTGWTLHPELLKGDRYLIKFAKNFVDSSIGLNTKFDINRPAKDELSNAVFRRIVLPSPGPLFPPQIINKPLLPSPSHGTVTASVLMSERGHPNKDDPNEFPTYSEIKSVSGVAPLVKVIPLKATHSVFLDAGDFMDLTKSIYQAIAWSIFPSSVSSPDSQIGVISISLGGLDGSSNNSSIQKALKAARKAGIVVIAAAGQALGKRTGGWHGPTSPGNDSNTICVAACNSEHKKYEKGFYGSKVDISAPGDDIWQARSENVPNFQPRYFIDKSDGTSYSTAIVAGACALWQAFHGRIFLLDKYGPELIFDLFKKTLKESCETNNGGLVVRTANGTKTIPWDTKNQGAGVLDAKRLLEQSLPTKQELLNFINP